MFHFADAGIPDILKPADGPGGGSPLPTLVPSIPVELFKSATLLLGTIGVSDKLAFNKLNHF